MVFVSKFCRIRSRLSFLTLDSGELMPVISESRWSCDPPAFAMITSTFPTRSLINLAAAALSSSFAEVSLIGITVSGCCVASSARAPVAGKERMPAKTTTSGRATSCLTNSTPRPRPAPVTEGQRHGTGSWTYRGIQLVTFYDGQVIVICPPPEFRCMECFLCSR